MYVYIIKWKRGGIMSDKKVKFRQSISGFNKDDVNNYIQQLNAKFAKESEEKQKTITSLEEKIKQLEEQLEQKAAEEETAAVEESDARIALLTADIDRLNSENESLEKENKELKATVEQYRRNEEENAVVWEKSSKFDKVSGQIGSLIISASAEAEGIIAQAKLKARSVSNTMIESTKEKLCEISEKYTNDIMEKTAELTLRLGEVSKTADSYAAETKTAVETDCVSLKEELEIIRKTDNGTEDKDE